MARRGEAGRGRARRGVARQGGAGLGEAGQGMVQFNSKEIHMKRIQVEIQGTSPLLIHRFGEAEQTEKTTRRVRVAENYDPREEATKHAYIAPNGTFYFSAFAIPNAMGNAGASHKQKGSRKTLRYVVPSAVRMESDTVTIMNGSGAAKDFEIDSRPVTIPATQGRVMRHRPRFNCWSAQFILLVNDDMLDPQTAHQLLNEAGQSIGIGDFRPEKRGPFGTFLVTKFAEAK